MGGTPSSARTEIKAPPPPSLWPLVRVHLRACLSTVPSPYHSRGGGGGHCARLCCCLQLPAPIGLSPLTLALPSNPFPPQVAAPIGPSPPRALP